MRRKTLSAQSGPPDNAASWTCSFSDRPPSTDPTLCFTAQIQTTWRRRDSPSYPVSRHTAARLIRAVVAGAAAQCDVLRPDAAEQDITATIHAHLPLGGDGIVITGAQVQISVDGATRSAALTNEQLRQDFERRADQLRHEYELDELARRQVRAREAFLRNEILANPCERSRKSPRSPVSRLRFPQGRVVSVSAGRARWRFLLRRLPCSGRCGPF